MGDFISIPDFISLVDLFFSSVDSELLFIGEEWLLTETLFLDTFIFVSFSVYSNSVRLNSIK